LANGVEFGGKHFGIVEDEQITLTKQAGEILDRSVHQVAVAPVQFEKARIFAALRWTLSDELFGKIVIKVSHAEWLQVAGQVDAIGRH
jgi:hypothetical protein